MHEFLKSLIPGLWLAWLVYWVLAARGNKETARQESAGTRMLHHGPLVAGGVLLGWPHMLGPNLEGRFHAHTSGWGGGGRARGAAGRAGAAAARGGRGGGGGGAGALK